MGSLAEQFKAQMNREETERDRNLREGRRNLRKFCNLRKPDFYKETRTYQDELCNTLQATYERSLSVKRRAGPLNT